MSCECRGSSYEIYEDPQALWLELGPAYDAYRAGNVSVSRSWEPKKGLVGDWLPPCCGELSGDWTFDDLWLPHTIMLAFYIAISGSLLGIMIYLRDQQPFKFRDMKAVTVLWLVITFCMINGVMAGNMGGTGPIVPGLVFSFLGPSLMMYHYTMKALQLYFICSWQEAKMNKTSFEKLRTFQRLRYILEPRTYFIGMAVVGVLFSIPVIYAVTSREIYANAAATNGYQTLRCEWWNIPDEYTVAKSSSLLCPCIRLQSPLGGGSQLECMAGVMSLCVDHVGGTPQDASFCDVCFTDLASLAAGPTPECRDWFQKFYLAGNCGFPKQTPHAASCMSGVFADRPLATFDAASSYFLLFVNLLSLAALYNKKDDFGLITENVGCVLALSVTIVFMFSSAYPDRGGLMDWYYEDLGIKYRELFLCTFLCGWTFVVMVQIYPLLLYVQRRRQLWLNQRGKRTGPARRKTLSRGPDGLSQPSTGLPDSDTNRVAHPSGRSRASTDAEHEVEDCIRTPALLGIYGSYAVQAFHAENVQFLADCTRFFDAARGDLSEAALRELATTARNLYEQYIAADATLEVNLPAKVRDAILAALAKFEAMVAVSFDQGSEAAAATKVPATENCTVALGELVDSLGTAYADIRRLLARDAWPRFKRSRFYERYTEILDDEQRVTNAVELIYSPSSTAELLDAPAEEDDELAQQQHTLDQLPIRDDDQDFEQLEKLTLRMKPIPSQKSPRRSSQNSDP